MQKCGKQKIILQQYNKLYSRTVWNACDNKSEGTGNNEIYTYLVQYVEKWH